MTTLVTTCVLVSCGANDRVEVITAWLLIMVVVLTGAADEGGGATEVVSTGVEAAWLVGGAEAALELIAAIEM